MRRSASFPQPAGLDSYGSTPRQALKGLGGRHFLAFSPYEAGARSDIANSLNNLDELQHKASRLNLSARIRHLAQLLTIMELAITFDGVLAAGTAVIPFESHSCGGGTLDESLLQLAG